MTNGETKKTRFRSGMSDVLSGDIAKSPEKTGTDDLSFHRMYRQASLVPSPKLQHIGPVVFAVESPPREREIGTGESPREKAILDLLKKEVDTALSTS